jgi:hypothetical protein
VLRSREVNKVVDESVFVQARHTDAAEKEIGVGGKDVGVGNVDARPQAESDVVELHRSEVAAEEIEGSRRV